MARAQVLDAIDAGDTAAPLDAMHSLLEQPLGATREDERRLLYRTAVLLGAA